MLVYTVIERVKTTIVEVLEGSAKLFQSYVCDHTLNLYFVRKSEELSIPCHVQPVVLTAPRWRAARG